MRLKPEVKDYELMELNEDCSARVTDTEGFKKMMVFYRYGKLVWAHRDCVAPKPSRLPRKSRKNHKKNT